MTTQTEFTCGIYTATFNEIGGPKWFIKASQHVLALAEENGHTLKFTKTPFLTVDDLVEIAVLMNNIKRQYKQHANTSHP